MTATKISSGTKQIALPPIEAFSLTNETKVPSSDDSVQMSSGSISQADDNDVPESQSVSSASSKSVSTSQEREDDDKCFEFEEDETPGLVTVELDTGDATLSPTSIETEGSKEKTASIICEGVWRRLGCLKKPKLEM